jgi:hypothetical protein
LDFRFWIEERKGAVFELLINLRTVKALGLTIPPIVLMRAQRVVK